MAAAKDYQSYLKNKCIVGYGIVNGVVNALIFMGMHAGGAPILPLPPVRLSRRLR